MEAGENKKVESNINVPARNKDDLSLDKGKFNTPAEAAKEKYDRMVAEDEMLTDDFGSRSEASLDILVGVVSVILREFNQITEIEDTDSNTEREMVAHKSVCYYMMNNGCMEEKNALFERPDEAMKI